MPTSLLLPDTEPITRAVWPGQGMLSRLDAVVPAVVTLLGSGWRSTPEGKVASMTAIHSRKAFALLEAYLHGGVIPAAFKAGEIGVLADLDSCRETMYEVVNIANFLVRQLAEQSGRTIDDELSILRAEIEYSISDLNEQLGIREDPRHPAPPPPSEAPPTSD